MTARVGGVAALPTLRADRRLAIALCLIILVALGVRLAAVKATSFTPRTDAADYDRHAVSLVEHHRYPPSDVSGGHGATAFRPPAFPYLLAGVYEVSGTHQTARLRAARALEAILGALTVALIALLAIQVAGGAAGIAAASLAAVYPPMVALNTSLLSESVYIPAQLAAVACVLAHRRSPHGWRWLVAAGALAGVCALARSTGVLLIVALAIGAWRPPRRSLSALAAPMALLLTAAVVIAPWTVRNARAMDALVPISTQSGYALAGQYNATSRGDSRYQAAWRPPLAAPEYAPLIRRPDLSEAEIDKRLRHRAVSFATDHPGYPLKVAFWNTLRLLDLDSRGLERQASYDLGIPVGLAIVETIAFFCAALLALVGALTLAARRVPRFVWLVPASVVLSAVFISGQTRYRVPADPFVLILASFAIAAGWPRLRARSQR